MSLILLYPLFWLVFFIRIRQKSEKKLYCAIILLFFFSALASCYLVYLNPNYKGTQLSFIAIVYHIVMLWLMVSPLNKYDNLRAVGIEPTTSSIMKPLTIATVVIMLTFTITKLPEVSMRAIVDDVGGLRQLLYEEKNESFFFRYAFYLGKAFAVVPLCLMFYYIKFKPQSTLLILLLFFCSLGQAIASLAVAGREYIVKYIFLFLALYYLMGSDINKAWNHRLKTIIVIVSVLFGAVFMLITYLRFTVTRDIAASDTILSYFGQGNVNFSDIFVEFPNGIYDKKGQHFFPLIFGRPSMSHYNLNDMIVTDLRLNTFSTGIGSWIKDCGVFITVFVTVVFSLIFRKVGTLKTYNIFTLIYFAMVYEQIFSLLFFFHGAWNGTRIFCILILIVMDLMSRGRIRSS